LLFILSAHVAVLPHASVALYVLVVVSVHPERFTASLTNVITGVPQPSVAVTNVISGAGTAPLHAATVFDAGHVITDGVTSTVLVIVCAHVAVLPHASVALYVLVVVSVHPERFTASLTNVITGVPQPSVAVTNVISGAGTAPLHAATVFDAGHVITDGVTSTVLVIVCAHVAVLPHASVALYVLVVVSVHPERFTASLTNVITGVPQPSVAVTNVISGAGTAPLHAATVIGAGHVITGGVTSTVLVIVCAHVAVLPHASVALYVLVVVSVHPERFTASLTN